MSCTDLSNNSRKQTPQHPNGLSTVCQGIDFVSLTSKACQASDDGHHFHIGKLRNVARKQLVFHCEAWWSHLSVCRGTFSKDFRVHAAFNIETLKCLEAAAGRRQILRNIANGVGRQNTHVQGTAELTDQ